MKDPWNADKLESVSNFNAFLHLREEVDGEGEEEEGEENTSMNQEEEKERARAFGAVDWTSSCSVESAAHNHQIKRCKFSPKI